MGDELEVQVINSPYLTLEVDIKSIIEEHVTEAVGEYFDNYDWYAMLRDNRDTIVEIAQEDISVHDEIHDVVNDMGFVKSDDLDVADEVIDAVRSQLRQFNRLDSFSDACTLGEAFIEAVQKVANVSRVDMQQALNNQFKNATIKVEFPLDSSD
jgi:hypothetical protein